MLFRELQKIIATIAFYDNKEGWRAFVEEVLRQDIPGLRSALGSSTATNPADAGPWTRLAIGAGWYSRLIKPLPVVIELMVESLREKQGPAHSRAALAGALAHVVQKDDIIPDQTNGGYGLLDDAIIIYYTYYRFLKDLSSLLPEYDQALSNYCRELESVMRIGLRIFPRHSVSSLRTILSEIALGFHHLAEAPTYILEQVIEQTIQRPQQNHIQRLLPRLAYHLNVRFQSYDASGRNDPMLAMVEALTAEVGSTPGEVISEGMYY